MHFDPVEFGKAMGGAINSAVAPLLERVKALEAQNTVLTAKLALAEQKAAKLEESISSLPAPRDGKDADPLVIRQIVEDAVKSMPQIPGKDGTSVSLDDVLPAIKSAVAAEVASIPTPKDGKDGVGLAGAMIDRDDNLLLTLTNGEVKTLGRVVGKDGKDGADGIGWDSFELEIIPETGEVCAKAVCNGRVKEVRAPVIGMKPAGYWRHGAKAQKGEAYSHDGSLWLALKDTSTTPAYGEDWMCAARKGRDGDTVVKMEKPSDEPVKLGGK